MTRRDAMRAALSPADLAAVILGGVTGAGLRWLVTQPEANAEGGWFRYAPNSSVAFESTLFDGGTWRVLIVNVLGCLVLGAVATLLARSTHRSGRRVLLAAGTGFCGSLTTFATLMTDTAELLRWPIESPGRAALNLALNVLLGALAFAIGRVGVRLGSPSVGGLASA